MSTSAQGQIRTRAFGPRIGAVLHNCADHGCGARSYMRTLFAEFKANPMWPWLFGAILLISGLVIIAFHQYWRSPAAIIVSMAGWFLAIRGVLLLSVPQAYDAAGDSVYSSATALIWVVFVCLALSGAYLTYVGWKPQPVPS